MGGAGTWGSAQAISRRRCRVRLDADGSRLVYHTPQPGDPTFVSDGSRRPGDRPIFTAPAGTHRHFPSWAPNGTFIYFVQGSFPDKLDIWRIAPTGGSPERITSHNERVTHPVLLDRRTLMYLASDSDGSGPWLYSMDVENRISHRLTSGPDRYTSLAASADGRRLVVTRASPKRTLWRLAHRRDVCRGAGSRSNLVEDRYRLCPAAESDYLPVCFRHRHKPGASGHLPMERPRNCGMALECR